MSKGQRGNKEAKKPKKAPPPVKAMAPGGSPPSGSAEMPAPPKK